MATIDRNATSTWKGDLRSGGGTVSTQSNTLQDSGVTFVSRFENGKGTNPEELIAAAHAACFSMALANNLSSDGHKPEYVTTTATISLSMAGGPRITKIHLATEGKVDGIDEATFRAAAEKTKTTCPISALLEPGLEELTLDVTFVS